MKHPFYPGIEFDPVEDDEGQEYKDNFFDMDKPVRWKWIRQGLEDKIPDWTRIQKIVSQKIPDNKDPVGEE